MTGAGREEHPAACSTQVLLKFDKQIQPAELRKRLDAFLSGLTHLLRENGCTLIGHIKGLLDARDGGQLFFSITSFTEGVRYKGEIDGGIPAAELSMNVIVYGVEEEVIRNAIRLHLREQFSGYW